MPAKSPSLRFVDCCTMVGKWHQRRLHFETVDELRRQMRNHHIEKALVFHTTSWLYDFEEGNRRLEEEISGHGNLLPCYAVIPFTTGECRRERLEQRLREAPMAVRLFPRSHNFPLRSPRRSELFTLLEERLVPVFLDIDEADHRDVIALLEQHPELRLVLGNCGTSSLFGIYREFRWLYEIMEMFEQVCIETSFLIGFRSIEDLCHRFGARRVLFGSRMPYLEPGSPMVRVLHAEIDEEKKALIAGGNLERLLGEAIR